VDSDIVEASAERLLHRRAGGRVERRATASLRFDTRFGDLIERTSFEPHLGLGLEVPGAFLRLLRGLALGELSRALLRLLRGLALGDQTGNLGVADQALQTQDRMCRLGRGRVGGRRVSLSDAAVQGGFVG
jgi:hypothetical protein